MMPKEASIKTIQDTSKSILTSGGIVVVATFSVYFLASIKTASEICLLIGRGSIISMLMVMFVLPGFLILCNSVIRKTTVGWPYKKIRRLCNES
jgi:predicted RND superfamily exporter protein